MVALKQLKRKSLWIGLLLVVMLAGCAGIQPYEPYDYRQEGLKEGLISGDAGEFVIYFNPVEPAADSDDSRGQKETSKDEFKKTDSEEKMREINSDEQQP